MDPESTTPLPALEVAMLLTQCEHTALVRSSSRVSIYSMEKDKTRYAYPKSWECFYHFGCRCLHNAGYTSAKLELHKKGARFTDRESLVHAVGRLLNREDLRVLVVMPWHRDYSGDCAACMNTRNTKKQRELYGDR